MPKRRLPSNENDSSLRPGSHPSARSSSRKRISDVFSKLADACNKHATYHQTTKTFARQDDEEENLPEKCRKDLFSVRALLPKVEKCFPPNQAKQCEASDVAHLCDFYERVLRGVYCPHSPALFQWGKVPKDVLSRVNLLFQHVTCRSVVANANAPSSKHEERKPVIHTIANTIAHLLSFLTNDAIYNHVVSDLISMLTDCVVIIEGNMLPVQLLILEQTLKHCKVEENYSLQIHTPEEAGVLQTVTLMILNAFLTNIKSKRLEASTETPSGDTMDGVRILPPGAVDMVYLPSLIDKASVPLILSVVRHMLFSNHSSTLPVNLLVQLKLSAIKVLKQLFVDWNSCCVPSTVIAGASIMVVRATQEYLAFRHVKSTEYEGLLISLLYNSLVRPPRVQGTCSHEEELSFVRNTTLQPLFHCVESIAKRQERERDSLDIGVLRIIHTVLHTTHAPQFVGIAATYCMTSGILRSFFSCLEDPNLSNYAIGVLGALLHTDSVERGIEDFGRICQSAMTTFGIDAMDTSNEHRENSKSAVATEPSAGSKRKRSSPRRKTPVPLQPLETSPLMLSPGNRLSMSDKGGVSQPCFWDDEVNRFLQKALCAGRRLEHVFEQADKSDDSKSNDPLLVLSGLRLILDHLRRHSGRIDDATLSSCLDVVNLLLTHLRTCCDEFVKCRESELSQYDLPLAQVIVSTGIYLRFAMQRFSTALNSSQAESLRATLDACACLGIRLAVADFASEPACHSSFEIRRCSSRDLSCPLRCLGLPSSTETGESISYCKSAAPLCICSLVTDARAPSSTSDKSTRRCEAFAFDCAITVFDHLPLWSRCYLLASLHSPAKDVYTVSASPASDTYSYALDASFAFIKDAGPSLSIKLADRSPQCALIFAPMLLLSQIRAENNNDTDRSDSWQRFQVLTTKLLESVFVPIVKTLDATNDGIVETLLCTFNRLKMTYSQIKDSSYPASFLDPTFVIDHIFGTVEIGTEEGTATRVDISDDPLRLLREMMFSLAQKVEENHKSPSIRTLRWECIASACVDCPSKSLLRLALPNGKGARTPDVSTRSQSWLFWLLSTPFSDRDPFVRRVLSEKLNKVIMADNYSLLFSLFASPEDIESFKGYTSSTRIEKMTFQNANDLTHASDRVVSGLFRAIDSLLLDVCSLADSQLSFTMTRSEPVGTLRKDQRASGDRFLFQRSAVKILASLCANANLDDPVGVWFFEKALIRLIRMWAASPVEKLAEPLFPDLPSTPASRAMAFGELARLSTSYSLPMLISQKLSETFAASVFCDILILSAGHRRETQYSRLESFIQSFISESQEGQSKKLLRKEVLGFLEEQLPAIVCQFVVEKDIELLRLTAGFKEFLEESSKAIRRKSQAEIPLVGRSNAPLRRKITAFTLDNQELERKTRHLCLQPKMIERILPLILINSDRSGLVFFLSKVLSGISLREIIQNREQLILKELVWQLGYNATSVGSSVQAIRVAATALLSETSGTKRSASSDDSVSKDPSLASRWVTSHFMYLLVNVIQYRWKSRTRKEQLHVMSCLHGLLNFLLPSESAQYFPQIMATVNAGIIDSGHISANITPGSSDVICLQLFAIKCLAKFVRLVAEHQIDTIAMNLTTIVVSLIPVLSEGNAEHWALRDSQDEAVALLEYLTGGSIGKSLSNNFNEIPFLPKLPSLKSVHEALRSNNVDFDSLAVLSSGTQRGGSSRRESMTSEGSYTVGSKSTVSSRRLEELAGLQKRLHTMTFLLDSENTSVRNVVLQHLTDLLRANRDLFHVLIENEGSVATEHCLTVIYSEKGAEEKNQGGANWLPQGTVTNVVEKLLSRCVEESETKTRTLLATCLGEIGAIGEHQLGDLKIGVAADIESVDSPNSAYQWRLEQPPWQSRAAKYELHLVTKHLAVALKSAPSSADQHKVAFTIQQLLVLLDRSARQREDDIVVEGSRNTKDMSKWLRDKLNESGVYEVVEPFWFSEFHEKSEGYVAKEPPFFQNSTSYYSWISNFCRWMVSTAHSSVLSPWGDFFYACRTAVRTQAGISMTEFILPLLILDRICFGSHEDEEAIRKEFLDILSFDSSSSVSMNQSDHQRAVSSLFVVMETLDYWAERETEDRYKSSGSTSKNSTRRRSTASSRASEDVGISTSWPADKTIARIEDLLSTIPLSVQAGAAARVGMHARALRLLEMAGRKRVVEEVFESSIDRQNASKTSARPAMFLKSAETLVGTSNDLTLLKDVLARLDDCETMAAIGGDSFIVNPLLQVRDSIRRKEASGDFEGALQDYERALQLEGVESRDPSLEKGILQCLLELGQFESVLNQVGGLILGDAKKSHADQSSVTSFAVEAAWRLGRWETLSALIEKEEKKSEACIDKDLHQISVGKAMLGLHRKDNDMVTAALESSRRNVMEDLSSGARESYTRSYSNIVRLHCIRELENAADILCLEHNESPLTLDEIAHSTTNEGWAWEGRLNLTTSHGASSVISTRVALARLCEEPALEGSLFLSIGKRARKRRLYSIAENFFSKAQAAFTSIPVSEVTRNSKLGNLIDSTRVQVAKLKHESGESALALKILGHESVQNTFDQMLTEIESSDAIRKMAVDYERQRLGNLASSVTLAENDDNSLTDRFARRLLRLTQWTVEGGLKGGSEITRRYRIIHKLAPEWEKGHFYFGKYIHSLMKSRVTALASQYFDQKALHGVEEDLVRTSVIFRDQACHKYILMAMEHYAIALKLDPKHVYQALPRLLSLWFDFASIDPKQQIIDEGLNSSGFTKLLNKNKNDANKCMANNLKVIPASAFYTAMPQLVSRVIHDDKDTAYVVQGILKRVLVKFPQQAMWPLAWLKGSKKPERLQIGEEIFKEAQKNLSKNHKNMEKLLQEASRLFKFLKDLAVYSPPNSNSNTISVKPWNGNVDLSEFVPPVQAALSISPLSNHGSPKDFFPRNIPRMRAFSSRITVMASKAKPKRIKAFAVPGSFKHTKNTRDLAKGVSTSNPLSCDTGEIHFLIKQEAKGDLRKDARVQDLNNVINRLMASSSEGSLNTRRRRLHLRTFAVTCLSEDTGIVEWVPKTDSLRNLVSRSYNPQTSAFSPRRRGARLANFGDPTLRNNYDKCQNTYFKDGNLSRATVLFQELCLKPYPPLLYWWFVQKFHDPHAWYEARNRFTLSTAAWSAVGHVIGLGDRHSENILVDTNNGDCVHVDFDCIFDKGLNLPKPEVVPFRLTANMIDAFGPTGAEGVYSSGLQTAMRTLRDNRDTLLSVLEPFLKDPVIDWKRYRSQQKSNTSSKQAKRSIKVIDERLQGIYNLRNPNLKKYRRTDGLSTDQDDELTHMLPLSVEGQVNKMIAEATSSENLVQLYVGWMPWV